MRVALRGAARVHGQRALPTAPTPAHRKCVCVLTHVLRRRGLPLWSIGSGFALCVFTFSPSAPLARGLITSGEQDAAVFATQLGVTTGPKGCVPGNSSFKNMFGYTRYTGESYDGSCSFFEGKPPLPEAIGWVICLALGCAFAALVGGLVYLSNQNVSTENQTGNNSEVFSTAGRTISAGLTAADVVSKWTWAATLLQSSNVAWNYGVSGPFWYASGATIQVLLFAILAIEVKRKCPAIHTMLEIVLCRWGSTAHLTFLFFGLMTCLIVTAMLILGGAATINALTGMNVYAANFAIPVPVMFYTAFGGLKGTYYASFTHTACPSLKKRQPTKPACR